MKFDKLGKTIRSRHENIDGISLEYSLIRSEKRICGRYSFSIVLDQSENGEHDVVFAGDISRRKRKANEIFSYISCGLVTVCTFHEVLEDLL